MTISLSDNDPRISYTVSQGVTQTTFTVPFEFFDLDDLNVFVDGTQKTKTTHYTLASGGSGATGSITMSVTGATGGSTVVITRAIDHERTTDFQTSGPFNIASLNTELDRFTAIAADLQDGIDRSLRLTDFDADASLTLPDVNTRKGKTLAFNASSGAVEAGPSTSDVQTVSATAADIATLADIEDGTNATNAIQTVAGIASNVSTVAGISSNVTSVAGNASNINSVVSNASNINTVAGISANVTSVAAKASLITSDFVSDLNTLAVTDVINDINTLATSDIVSDLNTLATSDIVSDLNTLATSDIVSDINTLATSDIVTDLNLLATSDFVSDLNTMATSSNVSNLSSVAGSISNVNTVASNISGVNDFAARYRVSANAPTTSLDAGDLWFDTTNNVMKVYGSGGFVNAGSSVNGTSNRFNYVVGTSDGSYDGSTTVFPATYDAGFVDVYLNGVKLVVTSDFTATNGTSITLGAAASTGDVVDIVGFGTFTAATALSLGDNEKIQLGAAQDMQLFHDGSDSLINDAGTGSLKLQQGGNTKLEVTSTGITATGTVTADGLTVDTNTLHVDATNNRIGVGTLSPTAKVHSVSSGSVPCFLAGGSVADFAVPHDENMQFSHYNSSAGTSTERLRIDTSGNVGINEASPDTMLHLKDTTANDGPVIRIEGSGQNAADQLIGGIEWKNADTSGDGPNVTSAIRNYSANSSGSGGYLTFNTHDGAESGGEGSDAIERMRLDKNGNLGIGTSSPNVSLEISGSSETLRLQSTDTNKTHILGRGSSEDRWKLGTLDSNTHVTLQASASSGDLIFEAGGANEKMRVRQNGRVGIGVTSPSFLVDVVSTESDFVASFDRNADIDGNFRNLIRFDRGGSKVGQILASSSACQYQTSSDHRLKENVEDMTGAIDRLKQLSPKRFSWIADDLDSPNFDGFLAHEAQSVVPQAASGTHNEVDGDGNPVMQGIDHSMLVPLLTGALQEAIAKIETLETKVANLEAAS